MQSGKAGLKSWVFRPAARIGGRQSELPAAPRLPLTAAQLAEVPLSRQADGMAARYDSIGIHYAELRKPEPRIAAVIHEALGPANTILNVGAGTGSYEP